MQIGHARATSERSFVFHIIDGNYKLGYIQRSFKQGASMGTGTTSDADWACQGNERYLQRGFEQEDSMGTGTTSDAD